jgi:pyruvate kinase
MKQSSRPVKIVATVGPASSDEKTLHELITAGVNVFRYNFSHVDYNHFPQVVATIRKLEKKVNYPISILGDIAGPKVRLNEVEPGSTLEKGNLVTIHCHRVVGNGDGFSINHPGLVAHMKVGAEVYLGDGDAMLVVEKIRKDCVIARVQSGGDIRTHMGFSVQGMKGVKFSVSAKDKKDIKKAIDAGLDALAISFVQNAADVRAVKKMLPKNNPPLLIAKIETLEAVEKINEILNEVDGVMVARGDLALAMPMEEVPFIQKHIIRLGLSKSKPVIVATQMLESMMTKHLPTRAEVADVTKAVLDGADCVMLSGETASGKHPVEAVKRMAKIIDTSAARISPRWHDVVGSVTESVTSAIVEVADEIDAKLLIALTLSGCTARNIARHRYHVPILAVSSSSQALRKLNFSWNVFTFTIKDLKSFKDVQTAARLAAMENKIKPLKRGDKYVVSAGFPFGKAGATNLMYIEKA